MGSVEYQRLGASFLKTFASVPDALRSQIVAIVDGRPFTWESAFVEVKGGTEKSKKILDYLKKIGAIS
jgi:hypothetical protein